MDLIISNFSSVPVAGPLLVTAILGGTELDVVPLYRGYALHVWFLPFVLILLVIGHLLVAWRQGLADLSPAWRKFSRRLPVQCWLHLAPGMGLLIALLILSAITPHRRAKRAFGPFCMAPPRLAFVALFSPVLVF